MKKSILMLKVEKRIGDKLENVFTRDYINNWKSPIYLGRIFSIHPATVRRWLPKLGFHTRDNNDYLSRRIKKPSKSVLKYYYHTRRPISKTAKERGVHTRTFYRWLERANIERRHGTEAHLKNDAFRPSNDYLKEMLAFYSDKKVAELCGINTHTLKIWKRRAGIYEPRGSKFDSLEFRRECIDDLIIKSCRNINDIRYNDFRIYKNADGNSFRGLLNWYIYTYNCNFRKLKEYIKSDYPKNGSSNSR